MENNPSSDLEESVSDTIVNIIFLFKMRDLRMIGYKLKYVLVPKE